MDIGSFSRWSTFIVLAIFVSLTGCVSAPFKLEALPDAADRLVARDFAQIISQVDDLQPETTVFWVPRPIGPISSFEGALREEFEAIGYSIQTMSISLTPDDFVLSHAMERNDSQAGEMLVYTVSVNDIEFRRGYKIESTGQVQPTTAMQAKGIDSETLRQDDSIFESVSEVASVSATTLSVEPAIEQPALMDPIGEELIVIPPVLDASKQGIDGIDLQRAQIINQSLLVFDGDSYILGESNKRQVREMINIYNTRSDVFSIFSCMPRASVSWTESTTELVIGRTERVRSELLYAGIPKEKIVAETCSDDSGSGQSPIPEDTILLLLNRVN